MMNNILISFCLPIYNVVDFIDECLQSVVNQGIMGYEIVCLDDCFTDGSYELLKLLADKYCNLRVLQNAHNSGVSFTRNELIRKAKGKYVWFVDSDDMLYPGVVKPVLKAAEEKQVDVLLGNYLRIPEICKEQFNPISSITISENHQLRILPADKVGTVMSAIWAGVFRKEFLIENKLFFNEKMIVQEDTLFYYECSLRTNKIYNFIEPSYLYRQRSTSVMHTRDARRALCYYHSMVEMYRVYKQHYDSGDYIDKIVLEDKLSHMLQNLPMTLVAISDFVMVKRELKQLKQKGLYPFKPTHLPSSNIRRIILYLLSNEVGFWMVHMMYRLRSLSE